MAYNLSILITFNEFYHTDIDKKNLIKNSKVRMDAVSHLLEDSQLRDEPVSGETDDPLDWRSSFIFIIRKRSMRKKVFLFRYLEHIYTNNQPETKEVLNELTRFGKENGHQCEDPKTTVTESVR